MRNIFKIIGPGLLYAGAAIGVSHLVQSTKAGALFNYDLIWILIVANILKYPFFEYGPRYANATGKSLVDGYAKIGKWAVVLFAILTLGSMFILQAAVTVVTVSLMANIFNITISINLLSIIVLVISAIVLIVGKYSLLDKFIKFIIILLSISTIMAVFAAVGVEKVIDPQSLWNFEWSRTTDILFLITFIGWMPAPIDLSVFSSLWGIAKAEQLGYKPELKDVLLEFRIGYIATALLAICFVVLGGLIMWGTGEVFSPKGTVFAGQLINMYTISIGNWAYWIISIAALTTMLSTTITVLDAYPRVLTPIYNHIFKDYFKNKLNNMTVYWLLMLIIGTSVIIVFLAESMAQMVNFATTLSFITAPIIAWLNFRVVTDKHMPIHARPGKLLRFMSWLGIIFFIGFTVVYFYWIIMYY